ncbi:MAG: MTAP family purine nucleoside phosphorylase [Candidatus Methanospirare jalkutatii]|nr:MTAP family purine nucleoside phosphorylase [Candidatus Methanospirare jalkutatii]
MLGIIGGTNFLAKSPFEHAEEREIETKYGVVPVLLFKFNGKEVAFIQRHGKHQNIPPHRVNHHANIAALKQLGVEKVIGVTSVGSLKIEIKPGCIVIPHDFICLCNIPTYYDDELVHITPKLDEELRQEIIKVARELGINVVERGIYFQTQGPRLETKAEIAMIRQFADVVGMNMASEATLACELHMKYANISTVDNYAHGIVDTELKYEDIVRAASQREDLPKLLLKLVEVLA